MGTCGSSSFRRLLASLACACMTIAFVAYERVDRGARIVAMLAVRSWRWLVDRFTPPPPEVQRPRVVLAAAAQYLRRQIKRERPLMSPRWRMCPSG